MKNHTFRSVFLGIVSNLITAIIIPLITIALGFSLNISLESKLLFLNMSFILAAIFLILNLRFAKRPFRLIRPHEQPHIYLVENNIARHIPDPETFNYLGQLYGFDWKDVDQVSNDELKNQFSTGSVLPSVVPHFQRYYEQKQKTEQIEKQTN